MFRNDDLSNMSVAYGLQLFRHVDKALPVLGKLFSDLYGYLSVAFGCVSISVFNLYVSAGLYFTKRGLPVKWVCVSVVRIVTVLLQIANSSGNSALERFHCYCYFLSVKKPCQLMIKVRYDDEGSTCGTTSMTPWR